MSDALKVMVEAMAAEIQRAGSGTAVHYPADASEPSSIFVDGHFDLEKVARAGLSAIRAPGSQVLNAGLKAQTGTLYDYKGEDVPLSQLVDPDEVFAGMIDAILKERP